MGRMSRTKGQAFERLIANELKVIWPEARRGIGQARSAKEVPDVDGCPAWIECKHQIRVNICAAMEQAEAATDGRPCVVVSRNNSGPILVTMKLEDWMRLFPVTDKSVG